MHSMSGWRKQLSVISGKRGRSKNAASSCILLNTSSYTGHDWKTGLEGLYICSMTIFFNYLKLLMLNSELFNIGLFIQILLAHYDYTHMQKWSHITVLQRETASFKSHEIQKEKTESCFRSSTTSPPFLWNAHYASRCSKTESFGKTQQRCNWEWTV